LPAVLGEVHSMQQLHSFKRRSLTVQDLAAGVCATVDGIAPALRGGAMSTHLASVSS
jgi:hypothetical protein